MTKIGSTESGKRHARFDPKEFLHLKVVVPAEPEWEDMDKEIEKHRQEIINMRCEEQKTRKKIDGLFGASQEEPLARI